MWNYADWLEEQKEGDEICWKHPHSGEWRIAKVSRVLATQIVLDDGTRWSRKTGYEWGHSKDRRLREVTQEARDEHEARQLRRKMTAQRWQDVSLGQLREIDAVLTRPCPESIEGKYRRLADALQDVEAQLDAFYLPAMRELVDAGDFDKARALARAVPDSVTRAFMYDALRQGMEKRAREVVAEVPATTIEDLVARGITEHVASRVVDASKHLNEDFLRLHEMRETSEAKVEAHYEARVRPLIEARDFEGALAVVREMPGEALLSRAVLLDALRQAQEAANASGAAI